MQSEDEAFTVNLSDESFETYELDPPPYSIEVTKKELKKMYYDMVCIRYEFYPSGGRRFLSPQQPRFRSEPPY